MPASKTTNYGFPLEVQGHVAHKESTRKGFVMIDAKLAQLQAQIDALALGADDSNSAHLPNLADSNSTFGNDTF